MERVLITGKTEDGRYIDSKGRFLSIMGDVNVSVGQYVFTNGKTIYGHQTAGNASIAPISKVMPLFDGQYWYKITTDPKEPIKRMGPSNIIAYCGDENHAYCRLYNGHWYNLLTGEDLGDFNIIDACIGEKGELITIEPGITIYELQQQKYNLYTTDNDFFKARFYYGFQSDLPPVDLLHSPVYKAEGPVISPYASRAEGYHYYMVKGKEKPGTQKYFKEDKLKVSKNGRVTKEISVSSLFEKYINDAKEEGETIHNAGGSTASYPRPNWTGNYYCSAYSNIKIMKDGTIDGIIRPSITLICYPVFSHPMGTWELNKSPATYKFLVRKETMIYILMNIPEVWKSEIAGERAVPGGDAVVPSVKNTIYHDWITAQLHKDFLIDVKSQSAISVKIYRAVSASTRFLGDIVTTEGTEKEYSLPVFGFSCKGVASHTDFPTLHVVNSTQKREAYKSIDPNYIYWEDENGKGHYTMGPNIERTYYKTVEDTSIEQEFHQIFINANTNINGQPNTKSEQKIYSSIKKLIINDNFYSFIHMNHTNGQFKVDIHKRNGDIVYSVNIPDQLHPIYYDPISQKAGLLLNGTVVISDTSCNVVEFIKNGRLVKAYQKYKDDIFTGCYSLEYFSNGELLAAKIAQMMNKIQ